MTFYDLKSIQGSSALASLKKRNTLSITLEDASSESTQSVNPPISSNSLWPKSRCVAETSAKKTATADDTIVSNYSRSDMRLMAKLRGIIIAIKSGKAIIEFSADGQAFQREIGLSTFADRGIAAVEVGDAIIFLTFRRDNDIITRMEHGGKGTFELDQVTGEDLGRRYKAAIKRKA